ncbi:class A beta-lactamase [Siphonobacter aquaeclarae]|uniref:Beta-lactamase n=1 Tax=Siphonobacter aquaeclarae TaxID=563176 RepID=A0A1G9Q6P3_9BACT|nr:class A beta-lactamase [Siphonobacter aquaeclarae]SDM06603.1 beta-lactamase class A [Siphonobacter aquaeclarae]
MTPRAWLTALCMIASVAATAQSASLRTELVRIAEASRGVTGIAVTQLETGDTLSVRGREHFPMQSVFKFPLALAILDLADKGRLSLDKTVRVLPNDLVPTYSPLREAYPNGNVDITIAELLRYSVSLSDNIACDLLFRELGGPDKLEKYLRKLGLTGISVKATEAQMATGWNVQYTNWCEPKTMNDLLVRFFTGKILGTASTERLRKWMLDTPTGSARLKGRLPAGTPVVHKTGTSSTNEKGIAAATNDAGVITLPGGGHVAVTVFVSDSSAGLKDREETIARVALAVYQHYTKN